LRRVELILCEKLNGYLAYRSSGKQEDFILPFLVADKDEPGNTLSIIILFRE
jgi:hypothetical protein